MTYTRRDVLRTAAAAAGSAATVESVTVDEMATQHRRVLELADRENADRWQYDTHRNLAEVHSGLINAQLDVLCDDPSGSVETHHVDSHGVPLGFEVSTDNDESVVTLVHLSATQAEALAVDLLEQAHEARKNET